MGATIGVDAHRDTVTAVVCDRMGRQLGTRTVPNSAAGFAELLSWAQDGDVDRWAVEGSGGYGAALCRFVAAQGCDVREVPTRLVVRQRMRAGRGKSDEVDALAAARAAQVEDLATAVSVDENRMRLKAFLSERRALVREQARAVNRLRHLLVVLDPALASKVGQLRSQVAWRRLADLDYPDTEAGRDLARLVDDIAHLAVLRLRAISALTRRITKMLPPEARHLINTVAGIGPIGAATLCADIGDIRRFPTHGHLAKWAGTAPLDASSGLQQRHRLNRTGNRQANAVIHRAVIAQLRHRGDAYHYVQQRIKEGKTKREAIRAAKRQLTRIIYNTLHHAIDLT